MVHFVATAVLLLVLTSVISCQLTPVSSTATRTTGSTTVIGANATTRATSAARYTTTRFTLVPPNTTVTATAATTTAASTSTTTQNTIWSAFGIVGIVLGLIGIVVLITSGVILCVGWCRPAPRNPVPSLTAPQPASAVAEPSLRKTAPQSLAEDPIYFRRMYDPSPVEFRPASFYQPQSLIRPSTGIWVNAGAYNSYVRPY